VNGAADSLKGWCPSVRRPMRAKDGLLVRLKISCRILSAAAMRAIAQAGRSCGNGRFDLTSRANLQIRGVAEDRLAHLIEALEAFAIIEDEAAEAARNILVSPLAGLDGRNYAHEAQKALEAELARCADLSSLPAKFGFLIDDGSALSLAGIAADIRFDWESCEERFLIAIGGASKDAIALGCCEAKNIAHIGVSIARAFLTLAAQMPEPPRRMRGLIESCGADAIAAASGLRVRPEPERRPSKTEEPVPIGLMHLGDKYCFGAGAPFGSIDADMLIAAARCAETFGTGEVRLTPWRALILADVRPQQAHVLRDHLAAHGFIVGRGDPRLAVSACGGSSNCERGTADTRSDALSLMFAARQLWESGVALQILGCRKGCGRQCGRPLTLVANGALYDLTVDEAFSGGSLTGANRLTLAAAREKLAALRPNAGRQGKQDRL
jgi:precorrin-3B synthase